MITGYQTVSDTNFKCKLGQHPITKHHIWPYQNVLGDYSGYVWKSLSQESTKVHEQSLKDY